MIDTHAHIDLNSFDDDRVEVIKDAFEQGVEYIIIPAVEPKDYKNLLKLASQYDKIFCGMGLHPHHANEFNEEIKSQIIKNAENSNVKAIGEIGIDYYYDYAVPEVQKKVLQEQLRIAKDLNLPAIIHNREADDDIYKILKQEQNGNLKAVLHCFSSDVEFMEKAIDLGCYISFTGNITFKKSNLSEVVEKTPLEKIMIETDSPFLSPAPYRGKRNEPKYVKIVAEKIAEIKSLSIDEVISMTSKNAKKFFNLILFLIMIAFSFNYSLAQRIMDEDNKNSNEEIISEEEFIHPYPKFIGIGPMFGSNTVVETYYRKIPNSTNSNKTLDVDISYEGIFTTGLGLNYGLLDYLVVGIGYNYSKNTKIAKEQHYLIDPTIYQNIEFTTRWIINPYSRVNFYGLAGLSYLFNSFSRRPDPAKPAYYVDDNQIGILAGLGMFINIPTYFGLFNVCAEWSLNFETKDKIQTDLGNQYYPNGIETPTRSFYSIPRVYLLFYPDIF